MNVQPNEKQKGVRIFHVTHDRFDIDNHTVYFHLTNKNVPIDSIVNYENVFIVTDSPFPSIEKLKSEQIIMVDDLKKAFFKFTYYYRHLFNIPVVAITGTCGKSTTKEMLKHILEETHNVQATISSKNADYYNLPYLMGIDEDTDVAVFETAVAAKGDMEVACKYFYPTIGVMTMIDVDHTDKFSIFDDYINEKAKIMEGLGFEGTLLLNTDDPYLSALNTSKYKGSIVSFGKSDDADIRIKEIHYDVSGMNFSFLTKEREFNGYIPGLGESNVYNAVAALAVADVLGIDLHYAIKRLSSYQHMKSHFQIIKGRNQITLVDDTWKSNPASLRKGLESLCSIAKPSQRKIVVLGRMASLGKYANEQYTKAGYLLGHLGIDVLITKGSIAKDLANPAIRGGMDPNNVYHFSEANEIKNFFDTFLKPSDIVYFKTGGNQSDFEDIIDYLK